MPKITVKTRSGAVSTFDAETGVALMIALRESGFHELEAICGGNCSCGTCHIYVDESFAGGLPSMSDDENDLLSASSFRKDTSRLSCQIPVTEELDGLSIEIAPPDA